MVVLEEGADDDEDDDDPVFPPLREEGIEGKETPLASLSKVGIESPLALIRTSAICSSRILRSTRACTEISPEGAPRSNSRYATPVLSNNIRSTDELEVEVDADDEDEDEEDEGVPLEDIFVMASTLLLLPVTGFDEIARRGETEPVGFDVDVVAKSLAIAAILALYARMAW